MLKNIYVIVKELFYVPKKLQLAVASMMRIKSVEAGEYLITESEKHPDAFIIAQGAFYSSTMGENPSIKVIRYSESLTLVE
jgi:hypothetical protein